VLPAKLGTKTGKLALPQSPTATESVASEARHENGQTCFARLKPHGD